MALEPAYKRVEEKEEDGNRGAEEMQRLEIKAIQPSSKEHNILTSAFQPENSNYASLGQTLPLPQDWNISTRGQKM